MSEDDTVGVVSLGGASSLVFSISRWRGKCLANVRKFVATQKYEGPTKAGLILDRKLLRELLEALARLEKTIPDKEEKVFDTLVKRGTANIRITIVPVVETDGLPWVDIREFSDTPAYQGPTKRGIRFRWNLLPDVLACFREQANTIDENEKDQPTLFGFEASGEDGYEKEPTGASHAAYLDALLGENLKEYPRDFLSSRAVESTHFALPDNPLCLEQDGCGTYVLKNADGMFAPVRNPTEGKFLIYCQLRGHREAALPTEMIDIFKAVKAYENYLRRLRSKLFACLLKKAGQESVANYETDKLFRSLGLPKLDA
jgi:hypothetical protein